MAQQADVLARLESVTGRLESLEKRLRSGARGGGGGDDDDDAPLFVTDFQAIVSEHLPKIQKVSSDLGLDTVGDLVSKGYNNILELVQKVPQAKKPDQATLMKFLQPGITAINEADTLIKKGKDWKKFGDYYKACYESVVSISWVTMSPPNGTPATHVQGQKDATDFNLLKIKKNKKDDKNKAFVKAFEDLNKAMVDYTKQYFKKDGLTWNPKGVDLGNAKGGTVTTKKEESKTDSAPKKKTTGGKGGGTGMAGVFGDLNKKGLGVTQGLKKVTADQKTKNRKDRVGKVTMKAKKQTVRKKGDAKIRQQGNRWMIENHTDGVHTIDKAQLKENVYIVMGDNATYQVSNKVKSVTIDSCNKCRVFVNEVVSTVEIVNCKSVTLFCQSKVPTVSVDKSQSPRIVLTRKAYENPPDVYTSNISAMNIEYPGKTDEDNPIEVPIPEQFLTKIDNKSGKTSTTEVKHG